MDALLQRLVRDVAPSEFPITHMSRGVARQIAKAAHLGPQGIALDVGTGSGVHAIVMAASGYPEVWAVDCNKAAIVSAEARAHRFIDVTRSSVIQFATLDIDDVSQHVDPGCKLISFNPPAFYAFHPLDFNSPLQRGVYVGGAASAEASPEESHLYRFFAAIVLPLIAEGGQVICSWPGLERRVVEEDSQAHGRGPTVHPTTLLTKWFQLRFPERQYDPTKFFLHEAVVTDYGLGPSFWHDVDVGIVKNKYSTLLSPSNHRFGYQTTFRYGILHLRCRSVDQRVFDVIDQVTA